MSAWGKVARYCEKTYGVFVDYADEYFICPECDEPIYSEDWTRHDLKDGCPICGFEWEI